MKRAPYYRLHAVDPAPQQAFRNLFPETPVYTKANTVVV